MKNRGWQSSLWCIFGKLLTDAEGEDDQADSSLSLSFKSKSLTSVCSSFTYAFLIKIFSGMYTHTQVI